MPFTLDDVLAIKYLGKFAWSPDGKYIAYIWDDGGLHDLWLVAPDAAGNTGAEAGAGPRRLTNAVKGVTDFAWSPDGSLYVAIDGVLAEVVGRAGAPSLRPLFESASGLSALAPSPDGRLIAFLRDGRVWLYRPGDRTLRELCLPGRAEPTGPNGEAVVWAPSGQRFAFLFQDDQAYRQVGIAHADGTVRWRSHGDAPSYGPTWFDDDTLYFTRAHGDEASVDLLTAVRSGSAFSVRALRHIDGTGRGPVSLTRPIPSPDGKKVLFLLEDDGWWHYYVLDRATGRFAQATRGACEDYAHAGDAAVWYADSASFLYSSNRDAAGERHIFRHYLADGRDEKLIGLPGNNSLARIGPDGRIAFLHCDAFRNMDLWVAEPDGSNPRQLTQSMPAAFSPENQYAPEEVSFQSVGGLTIHGYLMRPKDTQPGARLPAVLWVHGGPVRQMRPGWHPLHSYALFHAFNQYLVAQGYVVLAVNYRGGAGYGRQFREALHHRMGVDDVADIVGAANLLKSLPYVDPERVGIWGLSYGGYMTLHALTQYPDVFRCGVNIAGIWDMAQWVRWAVKRYGRGFDLFRAYLGGNPEDAPEIYRQASPKTFTANMKAPLLNLHGTADLNVDFQQLDRIVEDCVEHGKDYEAIYYPGEVHTFAKRKTWADALPKIIRFLDTYLKA